MQAGRFCLGICPTRRPPLLATKIHWRGPLKPSLSALSTADGSQYSASSSAGGETGITWCDVDRFGCRRTDDSHCAQRLRSHACAWQGEVGSFPGTGRDALRLLAASKGETCTRGHVGADRTWSGSRMCSRLESSRPKHVVRNRFLWSGMCGGRDSGLLCRAQTRPTVQS